eukprot:15196679-Alexandrium_andersonii.AAC.1
MYRFAGGFLAGFGGREFAPGSARGLAQASIRMQGTGAEALGSANALRMANSVNGLGKLCIRPAWA